MKITHGHCERTEAKSTNLAMKLYGNAPGFDSLTSRSLSLRPFRPCRGFPRRSILDFARDDVVLYGYDTSTNL
jgi:hypothetical protein